MIAALLIWIYAGVLFYVYGRSTLSLAGRWLGGVAHDGVSLALTIVVGMAEVTAVSTLLSLAFPLAAFTSAVLLAGGALLAILSQARLVGAVHRPRGADWWLVAIMMISLMFCLQAGTGLPSNPDTNVYHAQTIRWMESYRVVPGLGNLNGRLAYNSSWLLLTAAFSLSFLRLGSFHVLQGLLFLVSMWEFSAGLRNVMRGDFSVAAWMRVLFIPAAFWILRGELSSPGTDLPIILLTWILIVSAVDYETLGVRNGLHAVILGAMPAYMIVLKLSAAPIALVSIYFLARCLRKRDARAATLLVLAVLLMLAPWIVRSVMLSGYAIFPYPQMDLFHVSWQVPADYVDGVRNGILGFARLPDKNWAEALDLPLWRWMPQWIQQRTANQLAILGAALLAPLGLLARTNRRYAPPLLTTYAAMLTWLLAAPNWRFGYGLVMTLAAFALAATLLAQGSRAPHPLRLAAARATPIVLLGFLCFSLVTSVGGDSLSERLLVPMDYYPARAHACSLDGLAIYCASVERQCGYSAFPCVPGISARVHARGAALQDGFYSIAGEGAAP